MGLFDKLFGSNKENADASGNSVDWKELTEMAGLDHIEQASKDKPVAIFKHSTRCSISSMAKNRLEREWDLEEGQIDIYYLDLIRYRPISNAIAERFGVVHQSPQLILLKEGKVVHHTSHNMISVEGIHEAIAG